MRFNDRIAWTAAVLSLIGIGFNAYYIIWCWPIWIFANTFWMWWAIRKREPAQIVLWTVFTLANVWGWYQWSL